MKLLQLTLYMIKYNARIIFGSKLLYFLIAAVLIFLAITIGNLFAGETMETQDAFALLLFIGSLLIFYPLTFGIQSDKDARTLEIIFGIPNYRYRVWLLRMLMIFVMAFIMMLFLGWILKISLIDYSVIHVVLQVMYPLLCLGLLTFFISTLVKSGNGTAVIIIILSVVFLIGSGVFYGKYYNIFFNPFDVPNYTTQTVWETLTFKNHILLSASSLVFLLGGLMNLQKREKFL